MTDITNLAIKLNEIRYKCDRTSSGYIHCDINEIEGGIKALEDTIEFLNNGFGSSQDDPWPVNLLLEIGIVCTIKEAASIVDNIYYVLDSLSEKEKQMILLRYKERKSYNEINSLVGGGNIPESIHKAILKLSVPARLDVICNGRDSVASYLGYKDEYLASIAKIKTAVEVVNEALTNGKPSTELDIDLSGCDPLDKDISYLNLSRKYENILRRGCINTIGELSALSYEELLKVRGAGKKAVDEIVSKAKEFGLEIKTEQAISEVDISAER